MEWAEDVEYLDPDVTRHILFCRDSKSGKISVICRDQRADTHFIFSDKPYIRYRLIDPDRFRSPYALNITEIDGPNGEPACLVEKPGFYRLVKHTDGEREYIVVHDGSGDLRYKCSRDLSLNTVQSQSIIHGDILLQANFDMESENCIPIEKSDLLIRVKVLGERKGDGNVC